MVPRHEIEFGMQGAELFMSFLPFSRQSLRLMRAWKERDEICAFPHLSAPASLSSSYLIHL